MDSEHNVPLYLGEKGDPNRVRIGSANVDLKTGLADLFLDKSFEHLISINYDINLSVFPITKEEN